MVVVSFLFVCVRFGLDVYVDFVQVHMEVRVMLGIDMYFRGKFLEVLEVICFWVE